MLKSLHASRHLLAIVAAFAVSRIFVLARLGLEPVSFRGWGWHLMDPVLLKERLGETLLHLHAQPPLFNLFIGWVLQLCPGWEAVAIRALYTGLGLALAWAMFRLMVVLGVGANLATALVVLYLLSPASMVYEGMIAYDHLNLALLVLSAMGLQRYLTHRTVGAASAFFACVTALAMLRPMFHLVWVVAVVACTLALARRWEAPLRRTLWVAAVPLVLVGALYLKNAWLFQHFSASTWMGMNLARITLMQVPPEERAAMVRRGELSPLADHAPFRPLREYPARWARATPTGVPVLDQAVVSTSGLPNFNHRAYIALSDQFMKDDLSLIRRQPLTYLKGVVWANVLYFMPAEEYMYMWERLPKLEPWSGLYMRGVYGRVVPSGLMSAMLPAGVPAKVRTYAETNVPKLGLALLLLLPTSFMFGLWRLWQTRAEAEAAARWGTLAYLLASIAYVTLVGNALEAGENFRFRYLVDPFYLLLFGLLLQGGLTRLRRPGTP